MPYTTSKPKRLFFDIETLANPENLALMPDPKADSRLKDPAKIAASIEEKRADAIAMAALDPDYGKVLSIGMTFAPDHELFCIAVGDLFEFNAPHPGQDDVWTEHMLITHFWDVFQYCGGNCVGYNILSFDLPYLMRRSMALGIKVPIIPNLAKYRSEPVTDLMMILYGWDTYKCKGLKTVAKLYGIPNEAEGVDGSQVANLTPEQLRAYQASDVKLTIALFDKMNGVYFNL